MQPTLTTTSPSGSTWSQAYGWPSNLAQDLQHRHTTIGWSATAVWGFGGRLSSTAVWNATAVWGTLAGESTGAVFSTGRSSLEANYCLQSARWHRIAHPAIILNSEVGPRGSNQASGYQRPALWKSNFAEVEFPQYNLLVSKGIDSLRSSISEFRIM
jgi:hypothetical protein